MESRQGKLGVDNLVLGALRNPNEVLTTFPELWRGRPFWIFLELRGNQKEPVNMIWKACDTPCDTPSEHTKVQGCRYVGMLLGRLTREHA